MKLVQQSVLLGFWASLALSKQLPLIPKGSESGGGIAPWAGLGPKPPASPKRPKPAVNLNFQPSGRVSAVPVGSIIRSCTVPGTIALTFDDGPYIYTSQVLDVLRNNNVHATFFVNGDNWQNILTDASQGLIRRMNDEGHQIGSHTWAHADLGTLDRGGIINQMTLLQSALTQILGFYPTYMRPPYFSTNDLVLQVMNELGYHVITADIDTLDWQNDNENAIQTSVQRFRDGLNSGGTIELSHDVHQWTARTLAQSMIDEVRSRGLRAVTVGECFGDPREAWYRT